MSVSVCASPPFHPLPRPSPNLGSDVAPSYSTFPRVSSPSRQSPGRLTGEAAHPRGFRAQGGAGQGGSRSAASPCPTPPARAGRGSERRGDWVSAGSARLSRLPPLQACPQAEARDRGRGWLLGPPCARAPFAARTSRLLATFSSVGRELAAGVGVGSKGVRANIVFRGHFAALRGRGSPPPRRTKP